MSPEQARGETLDQRSDLFSLGSVLYTLCTGRVAFAADNTLAVLKRVCEETPRTIREINPDIPEWLAAVVDRLLAKESAERFQTASELAEVLGQQLAQMQQSRMTPAPARERQAAAPPAAAQGEPVGQTTRKRKRLAVAAGLFGLVGVAACLVTVAVLRRPGLGTQSNKRPVADDPRVLTVSKNREDGARFSTIQAALDAVDPGMTIRVLDDAVYQEYLLINRPGQHRDVVMEARNNATIRKVPGRAEGVWISGVPGFTLRGFRFESGSEMHAQVNINRYCPGVVLDRLDMRSGYKCVDVHEAPLSGNDAPIVIQTFKRNGLPQV
jgi:hypothetical protein